MLVASKREGTLTVDNWNLGLLTADNCEEEIDRDSLDIDSIVFFRGDFGLSIIVVKWNENLKRTAKP